MSKELPISNYEDTLTFSGGFTSVRAYDIDQVDSLCIQTPYCLRMAWKREHDDLCPMWGGDFSNATSGDGEERESFDHDYGY